MYTRLTHLISLTGLMSRRVSTTFSLQCESRGIIRQRMTSQIQSISKKARPILEAAGVTKAAVFGSYARGEQKSNSDIDLLVELPPEASLLDLAGLKIDLEEELRREVDLLTFNGIHPPLKAGIKAEQQVIL